MQKIAQPVPKRIVENALGILARQNRSSAGLSILATRCRAACVKYIIARIHNLYFARDFRRMDTIGQQKLWTYNTKLDLIEETKCSSIRKSRAYDVKNYTDLATKIAALQYMNRDFILLFRGQSEDYRNNARRTTLKPSLMRPPPGKKAVDAATLLQRFEALREAEKLLSTQFEAAKLMGRNRLRRQRILRWSILQHYEVCATPLLDVTHSLRIAASFASNTASAESFVFVLGIPNLSGAVTASAEAGLQVIRLSSVCPPSALRPHIQEGYLLGEYPEIGDFDQHSLHKDYEVDFGRRLVAKFRFNPQVFWKEAAFPKGIIPLTHLL